MLPLYVVAIFVGAALLFLVQPMTARQVLPVLGGGASVWTTCMLFFQCALLGGYLYAHLLTRRWRARTQVIVHACVMATAVGATFLVGRPQGGPEPGAWPVPWLLWTLAATVGPGFFVLASAGPLLQRWFSESGHERSSNPYFLYAASNAGSLIGLVAYPFALEPALGIGSQRLVWAVGFACFVALGVACGARFARPRKRALSRQERKRAAKEQTLEPADAPLSWRERARWAFLAFVPSSLMLGVTSYLSSDIAVFPLLWVVPLGLYLLSFMIAFGRAGLAGSAWAEWGGVFALVVLVLTYVAGGQNYQLPSWGIVGVHLVGFAVIATWIHGKLAVSAPRPARLTEYYLVIAVGGALGGVFNALIAPVVFLIPIEYTLVLAAAGLARPWTEGGLWRGKIGRAALIALPILYFPASWIGMALVGDAPDLPRQLRFAVALGIPAAFALIASRHGLILALTLGFITAGNAALTITREGTIYFERSFFGTMRVTATADDGHAMHELWHGSTKHGSQVLSPIEILRRTPLMYYSRPGPAGDVMNAYQSRPGSCDVAVVGLGTGALAAFTRPGDRMVFYEIDPAVLGIAQNTDLFTYLAEAPGEIEHVLGDGRLSLARLGPGERYDVIVLDAFSSDAIPVHLLTREAFELYFERLNPGGAVLVHVSNRYLDLTPVLKGAAGPLDAQLLMRVHLVSRDERGLGIYPSSWALITPPGSDPVPLPGTWVVPPASIAPLEWTDDYSNIVSLIEWTD